MKREHATGSELPATVSAFASSSAKRRFWIFCSATFLTFLTNSALSYLSVVLSAQGMQDAVIGQVLSSPLVPVMVGIGLSGYLVRRYSPLPIVLTGQAITLVAFLSLQLTMTHPLTAAASRLAGGLGFGLFWPAAMVFAQSHLRGMQTAYFLGIYSAMISSPNVLGPAMAEWYFTRFGSAGLFDVLALPLVLGLALVLGLGSGPSVRPQAAGRGMGYVALLRMKDLLLPNLSILTVGLVWGFAFSFMALLLHRRGIATAYFFSSCTASLLVARLSIMAALSKRPKELVTSLGLSLMALGCASIVVPTNATIAIVLGGVLLGLGYSMTFPVLSVWVLSRFEPAERGKPVALFGALFHIGIYAAPALGGILTGYLSLDGSLGVLGAISLALSMVLAAANRAEARAVPVG